MHERGLKFILWYLLSKTLGTTFFGCVEEARESSAWVALIGTLASQCLSACKKTVLSLKAIYYNSAWKIEECKYKGMYISAQNPDLSYKLMESELAETAEMEQYCTSVIYIKKPITGVG